MKRGFELSISVLVVIIISLVILSSGIILLYKFYAGSVDIKQQLDERTEAQLAALMERGERVAVPFSSATLRRGDQQVIGVGVLNIDGSSSHDYAVSVELSDAFDEHDAVIASIDLDKWLLYDTESRTLGPNEQWKLPVLFMVPKNAESGRYIFNIRVSEDSSDYAIKKVYITVA